MALVTVYYIDDRAAPRFQLPGASAATVAQSRAAGEYQPVTEFTTLSQGQAVAQLVESIVTGTSASEIQAREHLMPGLRRGLIPGDLVEIDHREVWVLLVSGWHPVT